MSSRIAPMSRLARAFSTTPAVSRPSQLLHNTSKTLAGASRKSKLPADEETNATANYSTTSTSSPHRPSAVNNTLPRRSKPLPFMQTFHHSAPKPKPAPPITMDRMVLPNLWAELAEDSTDFIRVPLLPDNRVPPPPQFRPVEPEPSPVPASEIVVVASDPQTVLPSALTEAEGMGIGIDGVELKFAHLLGREEEQAPELGQGMIRDMWKGLMEDIFGAEGKQGKSGPAPAA